MIDLHTHVLPGIDDGPETITRSLEMLRAAAAAGTQTLVATPHVSREFPNRPDAIHALTDELVGRLESEGIPLQLRRGAEVAAGSVLDLSADELARLTLDGGRWLLIEFPFTTILGGLDAVVGHLLDSGYGVLIAHPERCPAFHREPRLLRSLIDAGALSSITAGALAGRFGAQARSFGIQLLREGLAHNVASDAHDLLRRPPDLQAELNTASMPEALVRWLTEDAPRAILEDQPLPPRPRQKPPRPGPAWLSAWRRRWRR